MPTVISVSAGIEGAGSVGGPPVNGGHLFWTLGFDDGTSTTLEAGPAGPFGTGDLVTQNYPSTNAVSVPVNDPNFTTAGLGQALLGSYGAYEAGQNVNPVQYSDIGGGGTNPYYGNSNSFFSNEGAAAGLSQGAINQVVTQLQGQSGLTAYGADNFGITDRFAQVISGGDQGVGDTNAFDGGNVGSYSSGYAGSYGGGGGDDGSLLMC